VEQTDGEPLAEPSEASGDPGGKTALLKAAILGQGIGVEFLDDLGARSVRRAAKGFAC
jgi:hypothetical protein